MYVGIQVQHNHFGKVVLSGRCILTGTKHTISVHEQDFQRYCSGHLIQNCFSYLTPDEREFLISGIGPGQFDDFVGEED